MLNQYDILETIKMLSEEHLDIRTVTMGISLLSCAGDNADEVCEKVYNKICEKAKNLVSVAEEISVKYGVPIINKRISVTPASLVLQSENPEDYVKFAKTLDKAAKATGVNFIGGFSALVHKGMTKSEETLISSIPLALSVTEKVCSSVNVGTTKAGINMDAVAKMGEIVKETAELTKNADGFGCAKLVVFCNSVEDNPFMAGAYHGVGEAECVINVGVSGPGVVKCALEKVKGADFEVVAETI